VITREGKGREGEGRGGKKKEKKKENGKVRKLATKGERVVGFTLLEYLLLLFATSLSYLSKWRAVGSAGS
jgi:hypothetical protein